MVMSLRVIDAESQRHVGEEGGARDGHTGRGKVVTHAKSPLICSHSEGRALERGATREPPVGVRDESRQRLPRATRLVEPAQLEGHARSRAATRCVEHMAREEAGGVGADEHTKPHPCDLVHLRNRRAPLLVGAVVEARRERGEDRRLVRIAHCQDEWEAKLSLVRAVELVESLQVARQMTTGSDA